MRAEQNGARLGKRPRLAFLGVGWIGRNRMEALLASGLGEACAICDPSPQMMDAAGALAPGAVATGSLQKLLDLNPDGIVIATPSALHAEQSIRALNSGAAVFCQKPLGRNRSEVWAVLEAARANDRLIGVDFCYRHTAAMQTVHRLLHEHAIGDVYAADLVFHNAYGPDKPWFYDAALSGGGCVMDLGIHLIDLLLWSLDFPRLSSCRADLFWNGRKAPRNPREVEDYAVATLDLDCGTIARIACSWRLHAGRDAVIGATFYGTSGALAFSNVGGSFYDFTAELHRGTASELLVSAPDPWGGRAVQEWARRLGAGSGYASDAEEIALVAHIVDRIYGIEEDEAASGLAQLPTRRNDRRQLGR